MSQLKKRAYNLGMDSEPIREIEHYKMRENRLKEREIKHIRITNSEEIKNTFDLGEQIGQGVFGTVLSVVDKRNISWAMKVVSKETVGKQLETIHTEIQILKMVEHPHIIYLDRVYESMKKIYMVLERCYGTLSGVYKKIKPFSENDTRKVVVDLLSAVSYLHKNDIVHRDLKLENILIAKNPDDDRDGLYIKLTDFGLSIVKKGSTYEDMLHDRCGTLLYMAPEVIKSHSYSELCDVWATGVIMYTLLGGEHPFQSPREEELTKQICNKIPKYAGFVCSQEAINLISRMLNKNPALRITAAEASAHPWIVGSSKTTEDADNVLDMMRLWRSEMMLPVGDECDWVSSAKAAGSTEEMVLNARSNSHLASPSNKEANAANTKVKRGETTKTSRAAYSNREAMVLPVKNIPFQESSLVKERADDRLRSTAGVGKRAPGGGAAADQQKSGGRSVKETTPTPSTSKRTISNTHAVNASKITHNRKQSPGK